MEFRCGRTEECMTMMCPRCYQMIKKKVHISIENDPDFIFVVHPYLSCPECQEDMVVIDEEITEEIQALNLAGYRTRYSCAGHYPYAWQMYVVFENDSIRNLINSHPISIPKNMHFEEKVQGFILYTNDSLRTSNRSYDLLHKELLRDFKRFVRFITSITSKKAP